MISLEISNDYIHAIEILIYLQGTSRPDIAMAVHHATRFTNETKLSHERVVDRITRYLNTTEDKGLIYDPIIDNGVG